MKNTFHLTYSKMYQKALFCWGAIFGVLPLFFPSLVHEFLILWKIAEQQHQATNSFLTWVLQRITTSIRDAAQATKKKKMTYNDRMVQWQQVILVVLSSRRTIREMKLLFNDNEIKHFIGEDDEGVIFRPGKDVISVMMQVFKIIVCCVSGETIRHGARIEFAKSIQPNIIDLCAVKESVVYYLTGVMIKRISRMNPNIMKWLQPLITEQ